MIQFLFGAVVGYVTSEIISPSVKSRLSKGAQNVAKKAGLAGKAKKGDGQKAAGSSQVAKISSMAKRIRRQGEPWQSAIKRASSMV
jgi:hypothetical protein